MVTYVHVHVCAFVRLSGSHLFMLSGGECEVKQSAAVSLSHRVTESLRTTVGLFAGSSTC